MAPYVFLKGEPSLVGSGITRRHIGRLVVYLILLTGAKMAGFWSRNRFYNIDVHNDTDVPVKASYETQLLKSMLENPHNWEVAIARFRVPLTLIPLTELNIPYRQWRVGMSFTNEGTTTSDAEYVGQYSPPSALLLTAISGYAGTMPTMNVYNGTALQFSNEMAQQPLCTLTTTTFLFILFQNSISVFKPTFDLEDEDGLVATLTPPVGAFLCMAVDPANNNVFAVCSDGNVYRYVYSAVTGAFSQSGTFNVTGYAFPLDGAGLTVFGTLLVASAGPVLYTWAKGTPGAPSAFYFFGDNAGVVVCRNGLITDGTSLFLLTTTADQDYTQVIGAQETSKEIVDITTRQQTALVTYAPTDPPRTPLLLPTTPETIVVSEGGDLAENSAPWPSASAYTSPDVLSTTVTSLASCRSYPQTFYGLYNSTLYKWAVNPGETFFREVSASCEVGGDNFVDFDFRTNGQMLGVIEDGTMYQSDRVIMQSNVLMAVGSNMCLYGMESTGTPVGALGNLQQLMASPIPAGSGVLTPVSAAQLASAVALPATYSTASYLVTVEAKNARGQPTVGMFALSGALAAVSGNYGLVMQDTATPVVQTGDLTVCPGISYVFAAIADAAGTWQVTGYNFAVHTSHALGAGRACVAFTEDFGGGPMSYCVVSTGTETVVYDVTDLETVTSTSAAATVAITNMTGYRVPSAATYVLLGTANGSIYQCVVDFTAAPSPGAWTVVASLPIGVLANRIMCSQHDTGISWGQVWVGGKSTDSPAVGVVYYFSATAPYPLTLIGQTTSAQGNGPLCIVPDALTGVTWTAVTSTVFVQEVAVSRGGTEEIYVLDDTGVVYKGTMGTTTTYTAGIFAPAHQVTSLGCTTKAAGASQVTLRILDDAFQQTASQGIACLPRGVFYFDLTGRLVTNGASANALNVYSATTLASITTLVYTEMSFIATACNTPALVPPAPNVTLYAYEDFLRPINAAFAAAFAVVKLASGFAPATAPRLEFDAAAKLFYLICEGGYADATKYTISINGTLQSKLSMPITGLPVANGLNVIRVVNNTGSTSLTNVLLRTYQEQQNLATWFDLTRIFVISRQGLAVNGDNELSNVNISAITDVVPDLDSLSVNASLVYQPSLLRTYNLVQTTNMMMLNVAIQYQTRDGIIHDLLIAPGDWWNVKLQFIQPRELTS